jgi:staphyloferrin B biosynthesis citrate synthase
MSENLTLSNPAKERLKAGELALGLIVRLSRSPEIARIAKASGLDFLFIDIQHSVFSLETIGNIAQAALGCGVTPMVRMRSPRDPNTSVLLDGGVTGIVFPDVNTPEDAQFGVNACKFAPLGKRSVTTGYSLFNYRPVPLRDAVALMNENTLVVCMIETKQGLENCEAIAAVRGVDVLLVGTNDLLADMGKPGQFGDPEIMAAVERVAEACKQHGKYSGAGGDPDLGRQAQFIKWGIQFISTQSDGAFMISAATALSGKLRDAKSHV